MKLIGLTGGIGSGKTEVARRLHERGIAVIDADKIGHQLIAAGGALEAAVGEAFPAARDAAGGLRRARLAELVFHDATARQRLNAMMHPAIAAEVMRQCEELRAAGVASVVVEAALLGESGVREPWLDRLILVTAPEDLRVRRLVAGRGMTEPEVWARVRAQGDPDRKVAIANWVIENGADFDLLEAQVDAIAGVIHAEAGGS